MIAIQRACVAFYIQVQTSANGPVVSGSYISTVRLKFIQYQTVLVREESTIKIRNTMSIPKKALEVMEAVELYVQVNMGFSPSMISFILHLSRDYFVS